MDDTSTTTISIDPSLCQTCQAPSKYKCPRCDVRSCSVACVKQHKADQSCSGERSKTHYISMKNYNESNMMSDYVYLEDVSRQSDTVTRQRLKENKPNNPMEYKLRMVVKQARSLGIKYDMLPAGMSRRKANKTNYSTKVKQLFWTLEFCFCLDTTQERILEHSCPSNKTLRGVFENMLISEKPQGHNTYATIRHQVRHFVDTDMNDWVIGLKKEGGKRNTYIDITSLLDQPVKDCLIGERVIEYPTIFIWLKDHLDPSIQLEDKYTPTTTNLDDQDTNNDNKMDTDDNNKDKDSSSSDDSSSDMDDDDSDNDSDLDDGNDLDKGENGAGAEVEGDATIQAEADAVAQVEGGVITQMEGDATPQVQDDATPQVQDDTVGVDEKKSNVVDRNQELPPPNQ